MSPKPIPKAELAYLRSLLTLTETPSTPPTPTKSEGQPGQLRTLLADLSSEPEWQDDATGSH